MGRRAPRPLTAAVNAALERAEPATLLAAVQRAWPGAVGEAIARSAWPRRLGRDGVLHVATVSASWAFELAQLAPDVLQRLRAALECDPPTALRFAVGPVPEPPRAVESPQHVDAPAPGAEDRRRAAELAAPIEDEELRRWVARAAAASLAQARSGRAFW
jgi:hypothetical protein